jgi:hypothetical protein
LNLQNRDLMLDYPIDFGKMVSEYNNNNNLPRTFS